MKRNCTTKRQIFEYTYMYCKTQCGSAVHAVRQHPKYVKIEWTMSLVFTDLVEDKRICTGGEELSVQLANFSIHSLHVTRPHVLAGVDTETSHADTNELVEEVGDLLTHIL